MPFTVPNQPIIPCVPQRGCNPKKTIIEGSDGIRSIINNSIPGTPPPESQFISIWSAATSNESITLPYVVGGTYSGTIDWGDGTKTINRYSNRTHVYSNPGVYTIKIKGVIKGWQFVGNSSNDNNILEIISWGPLRGLNNSNASMFNGCENLTLNNVQDTPDLIGITNLSGMFGGCISLTKINNSEKWNTSSVISMQSLFENCTLFNGNIGNWDVSNVQDMDIIFGFCTSFNQNIGNWNVSNVTAMNSMFREASSFNQNIGSWNVSKVTIMASMFRGASSFNQNIGSWNVSGVTSMAGMFYDATLFNNNGSPSISGWNVSNVTNMGNMFYNASSFNQDLSGWCVNQILTEPTNFDTGASSWTGSPGTRPQWGTCP